MSTIASGCSSAASASPSARINRPSASVLWISAVLPLRNVSTSPSLSAEPDGMLSVHIRNAVTLLRQPSDLSDAIVASTAAAPDMSIFMIALIGLVGLRLRPPESYITPLPTSATCALGVRGVYVSLTIRGGSTEPALTPSMPPHPIASSWSRSNTSAARPARAGELDSRAPRMPRAVSRLAGVLASSRARLAASDVTTPWAMPRAAARSADCADDQRQRLELAGTGLVGLLTEVPVVGEQDTLGDGAGGGGGVDAVGRRRGWWRGGHAYRRPG